MNFGISTGAIYTAQKVVIYGPEGIGKTTLASKFPDPIFIDTEGSSKIYNVRRITCPDGGISPTSWVMLLEMVKAVRDKLIPAKTLVIDSLDWAETLCIKQICDKYKKAGIEEFGYGKGYTYLEEEFGRLLNILSEVIDAGIHVVCTAHAAMRRVELPEETGAYDHWEMKLEKRDAALAKEWADIILFCNYRINVTSGNSPMEKNKAQGGKRIMHTTHTPWWDAKNRFDLPDDLPMQYEAIEHLFTILDEYIDNINSINAASTASEVIEHSEEQLEPQAEELQFNDIPDNDTNVPAQFPGDPPNSQGSEKPPGIPQNLWDLMVADNVNEKQLQAAVAKRGYYPADTPISKYDPDFIRGCLVACWNDVKSLII